MFYFKSYVSILPPTSEDREVTTMATLVRVLVESLGLFGGHVSICLERSSPRYLHLSSPSSFTSQGGILALSSEWPPLSQLLPIPYSAFFP